MEHVKYIMHSLLYNKTSENLWHSTAFKRTPIDFGYFFYFFFVAYHRCFIVHRIPNISNFIVFFSFTTLQNSFSLNHVFNLTLKI